MLKGLPFAYNRDLQEDKEPLFDSIDTLSLALKVNAEMIADMAINLDTCEAAASDPLLFATDLADYLVKKGLPFRDAHEVVAHAVKTATQQGVDLAALTLAQLQAFDARVEADVFEVLSLEGSLNARNVLGGTAPAQVRAQVERHRARLA